MISTIFQTSTEHTIEMRCKKVQRYFYIEDIFDFFKLGFNVLLHVQNVLSFRLDAQL